MENKLKIGFIVSLLIINLTMLFIIGFKVTGFSISEEPSSPYDWIKESEISANYTSVFFNVENATLIRFTNSGSMNPILNEFSTGVGFKPISEEDIHIGDVISFRQDEFVIIHRVVEKGEDEEGSYFITKGDNNVFLDHKVRFFQIDSVIVAVIY